MRTLHLYLDRKYIYLPLFHAMIVSEVQKQHYFGVYFFSGDVKSLFFKQFEENAINPDRLHPVFIAM